jgi:hypothetical protein
MLYSKSPVFTRLLVQIEEMPVIGCYKHLIVSENRPVPRELIASIMNSYYVWDIHSAAFGIPQQGINRFFNHEVPTNKKWSLSEKLWKATAQTAYTRVSKFVMKNIYGESKPTRDTLDRISTYLVVAWQNIVAALTNLAEAGWLEEEQALAIAKDWLFSYTYRFYSLGLEEID